MDSQGPVQGVVAVIARGERWLAIRRAEHLVAGGCWCFPGGAIEAGEEPADALIREVREEVGMPITPVREIWRWRRPDGGLLLHWWLARTPDGCEPVPNAQEVAEARWLTPQALGCLEPLLESNKEFLLAYGDGIS
jgi:8-oxo-dGTP pyrophosphatase MutT (NUDIX family)